MTIRLDVFYPDHPHPRPEADQHVFRRTKKHWHDIGAVCRVCGARHDIEIHHKHIEWADADGVDWDKVRAAHPDFDWSTFKEPADFIDSVYNTEPLCQKHHRGPAPHGIHFTPGPIHNMQQYQRVDFVFAPDEVKA